MIKKKNHPVASAQNTPSGESMQEAKRSYIKVEAIQSFAVEKFKQTGRGITFNDLIRAGLSKHKQLAREMIKYHVRRGSLFTVANKMPQNYYPSCLKADVIESIGKKINPIGSTGVSQSKPPLFKILEREKARNLLQVLLASSSEPIHIHNIHFHMRIRDTSVYDDVKSDKTNVTGRKYRREHVGSRDVVYSIDKNGTVMIAIESSRNPFRMQEEQDVSRFFVFVGQIYDRLTYWLSDPRERIVPNIDDWVLKECDLNRDTQINGAEQVTLPDLQLWMAGRVFREYVKVLQSRAVYRVEQSLVPNVDIFDAIQSIVNPNASTVDKLNVLDKKIDELARNIEKLMSIADPVYGLSKAPIQH